ncbi:hypothetical protein QUB56_25230 [Microcoleus sp. AR_TQ3_B6]|uniref:hypothetical protein n=1 Tax=Microcoleus sp. AR_TQ3_B6 TaxID=3055284 RepID=UPI002FD58402
MKIPIELSLPFYELFSQLRKAGFPLGICDYNLLIEALEADIYPLEPESLKQLLKTIWVKTSSQKQQFDAIFQDIFPQKSAYPVQSSEPSKPDTPNFPAEHRQPLPTASRTPRHSTEKYFFFPAMPQSVASTSIDENSEVVKAVRTSQSQDWVAFKPTGKPDYLPVTRQQMIQGWYNLKRSIPTGTGLELDVAATIEKIKRQGKLVLPVQKLRRLKYSPLLLLIDQKGSMQPFHVLSRQLVATAQQTGCLAFQSCYYFNNYPKGELYCDPQFNTEISLEQVLVRLSSQHTVVLIFSDAGAARRDYIPRRIRETESFLKCLKQQVRTIVWLNPIPESSWKETTAAEIAKFDTLKMFAADSKGFQKGIELLQ